MRRQSIPRSLRIAITCLAAVVVPGASADISSHLERVIAWDGMPAPGLPDGTRLRLPLEGEIHPVINNHGEVAFRARLESSNPTLDFEWSVWTEGGGTGLHAIAIAGQVPPGVSDPDAEFTSLGQRVLIDETGHTAFNATWTDGGGNIEQGIWVGQPDGVVRKVVVTGMPAPDTPPDHEFARLGFAGNFLTWSDAQFYLGGGRVAFFADTVDDPDAATPEPGTINGIWSEGRADTNPSPSLGVIARTGPGTTFGQPQLRGMHRKGIPLFDAMILPQNDPAFDSIWSGDPPLISVRTGVQFDAFNFRSLGDATINPNCGKTAFRAFVSGQPGNADTGAFVQTAIQGEFLMVGFEGVIAPGMPDLSGDGFPDFLFQNFSTQATPVLSGPGVTVFKNNAATPDGSQNLRGIWMRGPFSIGTQGIQARLVARQGAQAPGLPPGTVFTAALAPSGNLVLNNRAVVAFTGDYSAPDGTTGRGLWIWDGDVFAGYTVLLLKTDNDAGPAAMIQPDIIPLPDGSEITARFMLFAGGDGRFGTAHLSGGLSGFADDGTAVVYVSEGLGSNPGAIIELRELVHESDFEDVMIGFDPLGPGCFGPAIPVR